MSNDFFTLLTAVGKNKLAAAATGGAPLKLTHMAVGDGDNGGYYTPSEAQAALKHEVWRAPLNNLSTDPQNPNWIIAELVIPDEVGGFTIREVGVFDAAGALIAVGKFPESYKPVLADGANKQLYVRLIMEVSNAAAVTLQVDPSVVLATRATVDQRIAEELAKLDGKPSVRAATTAAIALAGLQTVDGVALQAGDRVLVKNQANGADNGIYIASAGNWGRSVDANASMEVTPGLFVAVEQGAVNGGAIWQLTTPSPIALGTTPLSFAMLGGNTGVAAGTYRSVTVNARGLVVGGNNPSSVDDYGLSADLALPLPALPLPVICTPDNRMTVTATTVAGQGGAISIPAGVTLSLGQEVFVGQNGRVRSFVTSAWSSPVLQTNAEYYLRAQVGAGGLTIYVQRGQLNDAKPDGLKGSPNGGSGGGFYSTALDICLARVLTGAPGSAPIVQRVINRGDNSWSATMNGNGTVYLPFDPFMRAGHISTGIVTPHSSAISSVVHGSAGWTGYAYWYAAPSGPNGSSYVTGSSLNWTANTSGVLTSSNVVGDATVSTSTGIFEHVTGKSMWQVLQLEHQIGDLTGANGDEHLMAEATKNLLQADYDSGLAISFANCVNALITWEVVR